MARMVLLLFVACFTTIWAKHEFYRGYSLYEVSVSDEAQLKVFQELESSLGVEVLSRALPGRVGSVVVAPHQRDHFLATAKAAGFSYTAQDLVELLEEEDRWIAESRNKTSPLPQRLGATFDRYYRYEEVDRYMVELAAQYPQMVRVVSGGSSYEGRDIKYLRISTSNFQDSSKPVVIFESLLHAREWITLPATLYAIHKLVVDVDDQHLLDNVDFIIIPIVNPDGYEYSHTTQRLWRKNRSLGHSIIPLCNGVDLNRNFDFFWGSVSSSSGCAETFHGPSAFSEPEADVVRSILAEHISRVKLFVDVHSFGSYILYGWGHNGTLPPNGLDIHLLGVRMAQAIDQIKHPANINYIVGNSALTLYGASGVASDFAQQAGVPFSYTYELPQFSGGGFVVSPQFIEQAAKETWEGLKVGARHIASTYGRKV